MVNFIGAGVAMITPINKYGKINFKKIDTILEYQIKKKIDFIVVCSTTGESSTLTINEHLNIIKYVVNKVNNRIPIIAGTGSNYTDISIYLSKKAEYYGVNGILLVTPYYNKTTQKGLIKHYTNIANSIKIPVILYNVPSRTGVNILPETVAYLYKNVKNIIGIKEASGNISQVAKILSITDNDFCIYSGNDEQIIPILSLGGKGAISVFANIAPNYVHNMIKKYLNNNIKEACKMQLNAISLIETLFIETNPIPIKTAMNLIGFDIGKFRLPLTEMTNINKKKLKKEITKFGFKLKQTIY